MSEKPKSRNNKAEDVEQKPVEAKPVAYELPENLLQITLNYIANSTPRGMTVQEAVNLATALQRLRKIQ